MLQARAEQLGYRAASIFMELSRRLGLRINEIAGENEKKKLHRNPGLDTKNLDRTEKTWTFLVTKTKGRPFWRTIPVHESLIKYLDENKITGIIRAEMSNLRKQMDALGVAEGMFRKDFSHRMEAAGASRDMINLYQGRAQNGVLYEHYLTDPDRAVRLCRKYINMMSGEGNEATTEGKKI